MEEVIDRLLQRVLVPILQTTQFLQSGFNQLSQFHPVSAVKTSFILKTLVLFNKPVKGLSLQIQDPRFLFIHGC